METKKKAVCTVGWLAQLFCKLPSSREGYPNLLWEKSQWDNKVVKKEEKETQIVRERKRKTIIEIK